MTIIRGSRYESVAMLVVVDPATRKPLTHVYPDLRQRETARDSEDLFLTPQGFEAQWPQLGFRYLADARVWWAIADLSDTVDPFVEMGTDREFVIPSQHRYYFEFVGV